MQHDCWIHTTSYRVASILQQLLRLPDGTSHGRAWHGEEIGFIVAYAEGLRAGKHLQSKAEHQLEGCQWHQEPTVHPCHTVSLESSTSLAHMPTHSTWQDRTGPGRLPWATGIFNLSDARSSQRPFPSLRSLTSSLKGRGGTVLSRLNMSSHRSARMHSARLSTSFAIGPTAATTGRDQKRAFMVGGLSRACPAKAGPLAIVLT